MAEEETIVAALIGSLIGSVGVVFVTHWLQRKSEKSQSHENMVQRYLLQLQDSVESLWYRCHNLKNRGGRFVMSDTYFEMTMLYALGRVLAYNRIMLLDGIYSEIERHKKDLGDYLRTKLNKIENDLDAIRGLKFYRYDRLALAEAVMNVEQDRRQIRTYLEFRQRFDDPTSLLQKLLEPACTFIAGLQGEHVESIMKELKEIADTLSDETKIKTGIKKGLT